MKLLEWGKIGTDLSARGGAIEEKRRQGQLSGNEALSLNNANLTGDPLLKIPLRTPSFAVKEGKKQLLVLVTLGSFKEIPTLFIYLFADLCKYQKKVECLMETLKIVHL